MTWLESPEALLEGLAGVVRLTLETLSVLCVVAGLVATLPLALPYLPFLGHRGRRPSSTIRISFGSWLSMALEFQLGADIVATTTAPSNRNLIQLATVAVIRTFLNVFLAKELEAERRLEQDHPLRPKP
ncbi:DUF1622 domain-containing protein [Synechococcus sp. Cruz-9H2]|uniref:DUF1622 domain-containing protein n=1 Tax=unclassified Synechococcus TaxID=2626047 RepID=UPI0020CCEBC6|nr:MULTISPECIES: DUF1622 domain-containing protein [unclassified Synechococcus]MCP9819807.1 DUF1622 domain-containing protein [Synechococcus sp. Cruz-9H2]MCP9844127.1 DUF1622 domain-containing protein [Synechococcus sp. Edmonson 11F2]MCP9856237.1 DUF1622 domain-containing protein [Synechococcus sp. Cruz-9C9]MCP9863522.1 DUF1622 domain-containing protein [Synechococcus sp. Cruz-7E5]MCP9870718.1 DUF1622 domain-containing protein [Synechococcus sp. Cruz-7B9]